MASRAEISENLPDTLPSDFGEWDGSESPAPSETNAPEPLAVAPANAKFNDAAAQDTSFGFEPTGNVTPFPEPDEQSVVPRGFPAPAVRAPKRPAADSASPATASSTPKDTSFVRRVKSIDDVVSKLPTVDSRIDEITGATVTLVDRKPDVPIFSKAAMIADEENENSGPLLLNQILEEEEERAAKKKWIISACIFGGSLLLVASQLFHYGTGSKLKNIVATTQAATISETDAGSDVYTETKPLASHTLEMKEAKGGDSQNSDGSVDREVTPAIAQKEMMQTQLMAPTRLPENAKSAASLDTPPPATLGGASMAALNGGNSFGNVFTDQSHTRVSGPKPVSVSSGVATGMLIHKTQPIYPSIAKSARIEGTVVLQAKISRSGSVTDLQVVSGPPMLRQAAIDAVKTWQYKPYLLNDQPTEVNTTIDVHFALGR